MGVEGKSPFTLERRECNIVSCHGCVLTGQLAESTCSLQAAVVSALCALLHRRGSARIILRALF